MKTFQQFLEESQSFDELSESEQLTAVMKQFDGRFLRTVLLELAKQDIVKRDDIPQGHEAKINMLVKLAESEGGRNAMRAYIDVDKETVIVCERFDEWRRSHSKNIINEVMVPNGISLSKWRKMKISPKEYHEKHPGAKWKIVHCTKKDKIGEPINNGAKNLTYDKASSMHRGIMASKVS